jgi:hypothetical protein
MGGYGVPASLYLLQLTSAALFKAIASVQAAGLADIGSITKRITWILCVRWHVVGRL